MMVSDQYGYKSRKLAALTAVFALLATTAIAGVNEDFLEAAWSGDLSAVNRFIANGYNVNTKTNRDVTALIVASGQGHQEVVQLLLSKGADANAKANNGATALTLAAMNGHQEVVQLLLSKGADVNAKANNGATALTLATMNGHQEVVKLILAKGDPVRMVAPTSTPCRIPSVECAPKR